MNTTQNTPPGSNNKADEMEYPRINIKVKLSTLWATVMFCYIYADYFGLYKPGTLQSILEGQMGPLGPTTQGVLLGTSILMIFPSVMVYLSLVLKSRANQWVNIILGTFYTFIILVTMPGSWTFYILFGIIEVVLTILIVWYAWTWSKQREG